ncbi:hypothetical protein DFR30_0447 [Thiogranum longum]|uniref:YcgL domain-containing protein DFR30_0447 n=1 Tax=Thiogranum longum TaxID=1537524 RepID=A0A4V2PGK7_9GAMM|nr:YcgL domain-containing protein [Thiogranum longum]TCK17226.1 hypothetical protein DFR30_0447 [Thiogranum longum]
MRMQCLVYKSLRQFDYYLFVKKGEDMERVPDALKTLLGNLEFVTDVELHDQRKLAQADVVEVMAQIEAEGYYLQMPPRQGLDHDIS